MKRLLQQFILAIILLGGLLFLWPDDSPTLAHQPLTNVEAPDQKGVVDEIKIATDLNREVVEPQALVQVADLTAKQEEITIEVWNVQEKRPVPFAQVFLEQENDGPRRYGNSNGFKDRIIQSGEAFRCNEIGQLQAPRAWLYRWAGAEGDGLWGTTRLSESKHRDLVRIEVHVDRNLIVKIVDLNGLPQAGVSAHLVGSRFGRLNTILTAQSDDHGIATLHQVGDPYLAESGTEGVALLVGDPPSPPAPALLPLEDLFEYTEITLSATAHLELNLVDLAGNPILRDVPIKVNLLQPGDDPKKHSIYSVYSTRVLSKGGTCDIPRVPANHPLQLQIDFEGIGDVELIQVPLLEPNEHRKVELQQSQEHPRISFRVVDANGKPLMHQPVSYSIKGDISHQGNRPMQTEKTTTDGEGRVFASLAHASMQWQGSLIFTRQLLVMEPHSEPKLRRSGHIDLSRDFDLGEHELGDVVLLLPEKIAFGKVVDDRGKPLSGIRIDLQFYGSHSTGQGNGEGYSTQYGKTVTTEANGHFEIWGEMPQKDSQLRFMKSGLSSKRITWQGSEQGHTVVMDTGLGSMIAGQVLLPLGLEERGIKLSYYPGTPAEADPYKHKGAYSREEGYFRMLGLQQGPGFLEVGVGSAWPFLVLHVVEDIQPWQQGEPGDSRLNPLDLRESLHVFNVEMRDPRGELIPEINFVSVFRRPSGGSSSSGKSSADGAGTFLSGDSTYELIAEANGFRTAKVTLSKQHTVVTMQRALSIKIDLSWMPKLSRQQSVRLDLDPIDGGDSTGLIENELFSAEGSISTLISAPGIYEVNLGVFENGGSSYTSLKDSSGEKVTIQVLESNGVQEFHLDPPQDFFDRFLRESRH